MQRVENSTQIITQEELIKRIAAISGETKIIVKNVLKSLEYILPEILSTVDNKKTVQIKLLDGLSINCEYKGESEYIHPITKKNTISEAKIWAKPHITRFYNKKINSLWKEKANNNNRK